MAQLAVTTIGVDRPGIIAQVSKVLLDRGGNVTDSRMTILGGHFAIMLLVDVEADHDELAHALDAETDVDLTVTVTPSGISATPQAPTHRVSVYATDRPGLLHGVSRALADLGVNVTDLSTQVLAGEGAVYVMLLQVELPDGVDDRDVVEAVSGRVEGVQVRAEPLEADTL